DRRAYGRPHARLTRESTFDRLGSPVEHRPYFNIGISGTVPTRPAGLVLHVRLAEQVLLDKVVDGLGDGPLLLSRAALLGFSRRAVVGLIPLPNDARQTEHQHQD